MPRTSNGPISTGAARNRTIESITKVSGYDDTAKQKLGKLLEIATGAYKKRRAGEALWKQCEGKQFLATVSSDIGYSHPRVMCEACFVLWTAKPDTVSAELLEFRKYLDQL